MAHPSQWRDGRRGRSPVSGGSWSDTEDQDSKPGHRRPYSPVAETVSRYFLMNKIFSSQLEKYSSSKNICSLYSSIKIFGCLQLFRKDLISAMKLPDNEPLEADDYWQVQDTWKQEWERGVQVPVKPNGLPEPHVSAVVPSCKSER